ncbi:LacI family DNA-binding transcriptional regulator [Caldicellulosiruptoraceae bacterium PP1]
MRYTIKDIAKLTGYSTATISRAISGKSGVSDEKRKEILNIIEELGYFPDQTARKLRKRETKTILVIIPDIENIYFNKFIKGLEQTARKANYNIILGDTEKSRAIEQNYFNMLKGNVADGAIVLGPSCDVSVLLEINRLFNVIFVSDHYSDELTTVCIDDFKSAYEATTYLYKCGYRKIAKITGTLDLGVNSVDRLKGYKMALESYGLEIKNEYIKKGDFKYESGYKLTKELLDLPDRPDAIFCSNDEMAMGSLDAIKEKGLSIPDEIGVIGFDDVEYSTIYSPKISSIYQPRWELGVLAFELLLKKINNQEVNKGKYILDTKLVPRETTRKPI